MTKIQASHNDKNSSKINHDVKSVEYFLKNKLKFSQIYDVIYRTFDLIPLSNPTDIETLNELNNENFKTPKSGFLKILGYLVFGKLHHGAWIPPRGGTV